MNNIKVFGLMALMTGLVGMVAGALGGQSAAGCVLHAESQHPGWLPGE